MNDIVRRYRTDPAFHAVVDTLRMLVRSATLAPSEVREAAMCACVIEEMHAPRPLSTPEEFELSWVAPAEPRQAPPGAPADGGDRASAFGVDLELEREAFRILDLVHAEWASDPKSVQCFDLRIVDRARRVLEARRSAERRGELAPILTGPEPGDGFTR